MKLSIGIVGLPNVGKSTLFNAITDSGIPAENFPFCTIDPNTGIVDVPDSRLSTLSDISGSQKIIYAPLSFTDIAGLVKGASQGEGLGNQFLSHIREVTAIAHVVRCFDDPNIVHVDGKVDPISDIEIINLELILADLAMTEKCCETQQRKARSGNKDEKHLLSLLETIRDHLSESKPVRQLDLPDEDWDLLKGYHFITSKKVIYVANVSEDDVVDGNAYTKQVESYAQDAGDEFMLVSAALEAQLSTFDAEEKQEYLSELGLSEPGLNKLSKTCFRLLGLQTYLTTGEKETRAWTIKEGFKAPQAAGVIHTDFEKGFIRANVISYDAFVDCGGWKAARDKGLIRQEGKDYVVQDGDVIEFLFNV